MSHAPMPSGFVVACPPGWDNLVPRLGFLGLACPLVGTLRVGEQKSTLYDDLRAFQTLKVPW